MAAYPLAENKEINHDVTDENTIGLSAWEVSFLHNKSLYQDEEEAVAHSEQAIRLESEIDFNVDRRVLLEKKLNENRNPVICLNTLPFASSLRGGQGSCSCDPTIHYHENYFSFNSEESFDRVNGVEFCFNAYNLADDYLPRRLTGDGPRKKFEDLKNGQAVNDFLYYGTYWYRQFWNGNKYERTIKELLAMATMKTPNEPLKVLLEAETEIQGMKAIRNLISNVDGVLVTLLSIDSGESATSRDNDGNLKHGRTIRNRYDFYDRITKTLVKNFAPDYFITDVNKKSYYEKIKDSRGAIAEALYKEKPMPTLDKELWFWKKYVDDLPRAPINRWSIQMLSLIQEKRSTGLPCPIMRKKALAKFEEILKTKEEQIPDEQLLALKHAIRDVWYDAVPERDINPLLVACSRNSKVSINGNADLFIPKNEGGKMQAANNLLHVIFPQKTYNLYDGSLKGNITRDEVENGKVSPGEALFQCAFEKFLQFYKGEAKDPLLFTVRAVALSIQGKYRIATVGHLLYNVFLHPLAQCFKYAFKRIESTTASMDKSFHAFEFVKRIQPWMVNKVTTTDKPLTGKNGFFCSDWKSSTDYLSHIPCSLVILESAGFLGVPKIYAEMCAWALAHPRVVFLPKENGARRSFISERGILQGDPLTKNVLQFTHVVSRRLAYEQLKFASLHSVALRQKVSGKRNPPSSEWKKHAWKTNPDTGDPVYFKSADEPKIEQSTALSGTISYPMRIHAKMRNIPNDAPDEVRTQVYEQVFSKELLKNNPDEVIPRGSFLQGIVRNVGSLRNPQDSL